jgi:hypothetical protein
MAKHKPTVKTTDKCWDRIRATAKKYSGLNGKAASVGIQGPGAEAKKENSPATNVMVGAVHEFGLPQKNIPQRSFIGATFDAKMKGYEKELERISALGAEGKPIEGELLVLGEQYRADIINAINSDIPPPTQRQQRGSPEPALIDTGQLRDSISAVVVDMRKAKEG